MTSHNFIHFKDTEAEGQGGFLQSAQPMGQVTGSKFWNVSSFLRLGLNTKLLQDPVNSSWAVMTVSNWAEQIDTQGQSLPVSGSKKHAELDKSQLQQD